MTAYVNFRLQLYLGVWLECKLSFQAHIKHLQSKVTFRNKAFFTHAAKHTLVKLTILPILDFGEKSLKLETYISLTNFKS
jgi:hypothetical protein